MEFAVRQFLPMILVRVMVGLVFLMEGLLKFVRPEELGAGHFASIGLPFPQQLAQFVGGVEIAGGAAILLNFFAGDAALVLLAVMASALVVTKFPILLGRPVGALALEKLSNYGWISFFHQSRLEICLLLSLLAITIDSGLHIGRRRKWYQGD
jgi:uncharacterized membrane protein YphA (DoxX/SURF4 family)